MLITIQHPRSTQEYSVIHSELKTLIPFKRLDFYNIEVGDEFSEVAQLVCSEGPISDPIEPLLDQMIEILEDHGYLPLKP